MGHSARRALTAENSTTTEDANLFRQWVESERRAAAYEMYMLSPEELASWEAAFDRGGYRALLNKALLGVEAPAKRRHER
jgi:hypothetical protein